MATTPWDDMPGDLANEIADLGVLAEKVARIAGNHTGADLGALETLAADLSDAAGGVYGHIHDARKLGKLRT